MRSIDRVVAFAVFVGFVGVFGRTACPTFFGGDSAELAAAAATFGVPHPPGYPVYTVLSGVLARAVLALNLAEDFGGATALLSGLYAGAALALTFLVLRRIGCGRVGAAVAVCALGSGRTLWSQATVTEVYTFDLLLGAAAALALVRSGKVEEGWRARGGALLAGVLGGLWLGHRFVNVIYLPAAVAFLAPGGAVEHARRSWKGLAAGAVVTAAVFLYLPLASVRDPFLDIGDPSTLERFLVVVKGAPYMRHLSGDGGRTGRFFAGLVDQLGPLVLLSVVGVVALWRDTRGPGRRVCAAALWTVFAGLSFAARYRILDIDVYYLPALAALAVTVGFGADALLCWVGAGRVALRRVTAAALLVVSAYGLFANWETCDVSWNRLSRRTAEDLLDSVEPDALVFVNGDTTIHGLWYLQGVEGWRPDVVVFSLGHLWPWYVEQVAARFPHDDWPEHAGDGPLPGGFGRAVLDALAAKRPAYAALSVDTTPLIAKDASGLGYGTVAAGAGQRILPAGSTIDARELSLASHELLLAAVERLGEIPREVDMDSKSTILQYALALSRNAALLDRLGEREKAEEEWHWILRLEPDRHERDVAADVWQGLGQRVPQFQLERSARASLGL